MNKIKFESEIIRAKTMESVSKYPESDYWRGYQRGLRRNFHGENFGTEIEHQAWLKYIGSQDESLDNRSRGYKDGLEFGNKKESK